jgi:aspartate 4-decarboxylase
MPGDQIGIVTPIFSPYLEIPLLNDYQLRPIYIAGDEAKGWHVPAGEIEKLKDKKIKALFMVNPMNPGSVSMSATSIDKIAEVIHTSRPNLIVLTDTVYAPFVDEFHDLVAKAPENTICVYSYSKYFGVTGWRLGVVMLHENNIIDRLIAGLPSQDRTALDKRYLIDSTTPEQIKFIDRMVMDSRDVALAHTGGLSTPQQCIMALFSLFELMDSQYAYKKSLQGILNRRIENLYGNLGIQAPEGSDQTHYYALIDVGKMAQSNYGDKFLAYLKAQRSPLDILFTLAKERQTVLLPGVGFAGPEWSIRVSLANLKDDDYTAIGKNIHAVMKEFHDDWAANK